MIGEGTIVLAEMIRQGLGLIGRPVSMRNEALAWGHLVTLIHVHHVGEMLGSLGGDVPANGRLSITINVWRRTP